MASLAPRGQTRPIVEGAGPVKEEFYPTVRISPLPGPRKKSSRLKGYSPAPGVGGGGRTANLPLYSGSPNDLVKA